MNISFILSLSNNNYCVAVHGNSMLPRKTKNGPKPNPNIEKNTTVDRTTGGNPVAAALISCASALYPTPTAMPVSALRTTIVPAASLYCRV